LSKVKSQSIFNSASVGGIIPDTTEPICERAKLDTGTHCQAKCFFCYYIDRLDEVTPFDVIRKRIDYLVECRIKEADLSGGESSIHKDWFKILDYCREKGLKISTLSNGIKFADFEFLNQSKEHGLSEILFSLHGYDEESHNQIVGSKIAFKNIIQSIKNAHKLGIKVRINCTVTNKNYTQIDTKFVELVRTLMPFEVNFITLNYWDDAKTQKTIDYNQITPHIHKAIDELKDFVPYINVRYTPYCFMKGYEKYVCNYYQHIYDIYDWNIAVYDQNISPDEYKKDPLKALYDSAKRNRLNSYYKTKECFNCKYYYICDGIENSIQQIELHPESGEKISNPNFYRKNFYSYSK